MRDIIKFTCSFDSRDRIEFNADHKFIGIDVYDDRSDTNIGILLKREDAKKLVEFLKKYV